MCRGRHCCGESITLFYVSLTSGKEPHELCYDPSPVSKWYNRTIFHERMSNLRLVLPGKCYSGIEYLLSISDSVIEEFILKRPFIFIFLKLKTLHKNKATT